MVTPAAHRVGTELGLGIYSTAFLEIREEIKNSSMGDDQLLHRFFLPYLHFEIFFLFLSRF